jgi:uncharacterized repeat protein (TIGR01451 family)
MTSVRSRFVQAVACATALFFAGCASDDGAKSSHKESSTTAKPAAKAEASSSFQGDPSMSRATMAFPTGDRSTSVLLLETVAPAEVRVDQPYSYAMSVTNLTNLTVENVTVTDNSQGAFAAASSEPPAGKGAEGSNVWNLGRMGPGESKTIRVSGKATGTGAITRCATVSYNSQTCVVTRVVQPALKLEKTASPEVIACDPILLTYRVTNTGTGAARDVVIENALPQGWTTADGSKTVRLSAGTLESGQSRDFTAQVKSTAAGSFDNVAKASSEGGLAATSNTTKTVVRQPVLAIKKTCPEKRFIGRDIEYEITVSNTGDGTAKNAVLEDMLPAGLVFVSATDGGVAAGGKVTWNLGDMASKASKTVKCTVKSTTGGSFKNEVTARAYCATAVSANCTTNVEGVPALLLEVVDLDDAIDVGKTVTYEIVVTNQGTAAGENIAVKVELDDSMQFVSAGGATATSGNPTATAGGSYAYAPLGSLAPGAKAVWKLTIKALKADDARLRVSMIAKGFQSPYEETEGTRFY